MYPGEDLKNDKPLLLEYLHKLINQCWEEGAEYAESVDSRLSHYTFIDLTKAFDLINRDGLFKMLPLITCPTKVPHSTMSIVQHDGSGKTPQFDEFGVQQGCFIAPTFSGIFFALLLNRTFEFSTEGPITGSST